MASGEVWEGQDEGGYIEPPLDEYLKIQVRNNLQEYDLFRKFEEEQGRTPLPEADYIYHRLAGIAWSERNSIRESDIQRATSLTRVTLGYVSKALYRLSPEQQQQVFADLVEKGLFPKKTTQKNKTVELVGEEPGLLQWILARVNVTYDPQTEGTAFPRDPLRRQLRQIARQFLQGAMTTERLSTKPGTETTVIDMKTWKRHQPHPPSK